ncbi:alpha-glucan family phosphorylase [Cellvibrio japonicus]|uniref:Carbohydrate phosphosrylase, putative, gt35A n=1 Tax=Cellvibrio japonicus (strain Ueda107) TaxID=498211 RepID=B3PE95_CELJU|nr:alpha-glucan family phosphorylase [Cellvibrio japonicus]ACE85284.1 carbohydrate phosphosrylase, putative, gt35A [Cellvibrio japonicus Ueda107]QEI12135.1 glycosyltransferase family 1 protein [Cellvibrio japonicus]QEI15709.1 glycosyltransferase family 1 protein [Cellvibrio japonicus]QEI19287.1 glycosyltransferase family 1 protein [Cellvibrio japonicus]
MPQFDRALPDSLHVLHSLALDLHWSWNHASDELWRCINADVWDYTHNPVLVLQLTSDTRFTQLSDDGEFLALLKKLTKAREDYLENPAWYQRQYADAPLRCVAYFSMEFGICDALSLYAGGLGMLAGDYLKTASDLGLPLVAVGLLYQEGYFHQGLDHQGWQQETYLYNDPGSLPLQPLRASDGSWMTIKTSFLCREVRFRVWLAQVGRVTLYLLDSNDPRNQPSDRGITSKLYGGGSELRLVQEIALGICGWRLLEKLGLDIDVCHLNEGHAAFATLERIRNYCKKNHCDFWEGLWATRASNLFTTHTPVAAGFDRYPVELMRRYADDTGLAMDVTIEDIIALGRANPKDESEPFNMAWLAMRTCAWSNGVSALHGEVSRRIFQPLFPRWPEREVPVGHVTNGVHIPTWDSPGADQLWTDACGKNRWRDDPDAICRQSLEQTSDQQLWHLASEGRTRLVDYVRERLVYQWRRESTSSSQCDIQVDMPLDPNILTLGFARRFAEYKRPDLLLQDPDRLERLLCNPRHPVQLLVAGKAHPADNTGKTKLQHWHQFLQRESVRKHLVFIEDYDIELAQYLVQGVDVWINNPRRPWEASGTSGMKILVNGGLNLSSLDGWWAEAYQPALGWSLGDGQEHGPEADEADAQELYRRLEEEIIPCFYQRDHEDLPPQWLARMRSSMSELTPRFSSNRMLREYLEHYYLPAAQGHHARQSNSGALARELRQWHQRLTQHWHEVHVGEVQIHGDELQLSVHLGGLQPQDIKVQLVADPVTDANGNTLPAQILNLQLQHPLTSGTHAYRYTIAKPDNRPLHDFTARIIPAHAAAQIPAEAMMIHWQT